MLCVSTCERNPAKVVKRPIRTEFVQSMRCRCVTAACSPITSSARRSSPTKKSLFPTGKPVIQLRLPRRDSSPIFSRESPLHIVRCPIRAPAAISRRSGQIHDNPILAVEWISYPISATSNRRRRPQGKIISSNATIFLIPAASSAPRQLPIDVQILQDHRRWRKARRVAQAGGGPGVAMSGIARQSQDVFGEAALIVHITNQGAGSHNLGKGRAAAANHRAAARLRLDQE